MKNIILVVVVIIAIILIFFSFQNSEQIKTTSSATSNQTNNQKKVQIKNRDIQIVYKNKKENKKVEKKIKLSPKKKKIVSLINSEKFVPVKRVYESLDKEYEAKVYVPKTVKNDSILPPSIPKVIEIIAPSGSIIPIGIDKKALNKSVIVELKNRKSGDIEYRKVDIDLNNINDNTQITPPPTPPVIK